MTLHVLQYFSAVIGLIHVTSVMTACPHDDVNLTRWSDPGSWPNNRLPEANEKVAITGHVLLDVSPPALFGVTIEKDASLVWSEEDDFHLTTKYIHIKGAFHIGSETCPYEKNARITLIGNRKEYTTPNFGQKFLGVDEGGTLEIHGKNKLAWTKLTRTLPRLQPGNGLLYTHLDFPNRRDKEGLGIYQFNSDGSPYKTIVIQTSGVNQEATILELHYLVNWMAAIPAGKLVLLAVQHTLVSQSQQVDLSAFYDALETVGGIPSGQGEIRNVARFDAYAFATIAGDPTKTIEVLTPVHYRTQTAVARVETNDLVMTAESTTVTNGRGTIDFRVVQRSSAHHILDVYDDVSSWKEGDKLLLTSTDFSLNKAEEAIVVSCDTCSVKQVKVALHPKYMHYGEIESNVDMRAEVALLSRNIVIEGAMNNYCPDENENCDTYKYDTFGGDIKVTKGFKDVHIEGAELYHMGKQTDLGHYPLHFHMCYDVDGAEYPNPPYLRQNSVHHSYARCVTVHGTHGLKVMDNVGYESLGHCYFLEDGGERRTVFDGNLGASTRKASLISSDSRPSTFWITNPNTIIRNNVAAGSEEIGMWFIYPDTPTGLSADKGFMTYQEARYTAITEFSNNVIHSCKSTGFFKDFQIHPETGDIWKTSNRYSPKVDPLDPTSADKPVIIDRLTRDIMTGATCEAGDAHSSGTPDLAFGFCEAYKNQNNVWARGGYLVFHRLSTAETLRGITLARGTLQQQFVENSVFLGETNNTGDPMRALGIDKTYVTFDRSVPYQWNYNQPLQGFIFYDGPVYVSHTYFNGFISNQYRKASAIGFHRNNKFFSSSVSTAKDIHFGFPDGATTGNRVYDGNSSVMGYDDLDGDLASVFRDADGSVTTVPDSSVVRPHPYMITPACTVRMSWRLAVCPFKYIKLQIVTKSKADVGSVPSMSRDDVPDSPRIITGDKVTHFSLIIGGQYSYSLHWPDKIPSEFYLRTYGLERDLPVRVGMCLPLDATFRLVSYYPKRAPDMSYWTEVNSVREIDEDTEGGKYYHNQATGMLYVMLRSLETRTNADTGDNPGNKAMFLWVYVTGGNRSDADCSARDMPIPPVQTPKITVLPDAGLSFDTMYDGPEKDWGAGPQIPFSSREIVDGKYSHWASWSDCQAPACADSVLVKHRTRICDNPLPRNGGVPCVGPSSEEMECTP